MEVCGLNFRRVAYGLTWSPSCLSALWFSILQFCETANRLICCRYWVFIKNNRLCVLVVQFDVTIIQICDVKGGGSEVYCTCICYESLIEL